MLVLGAALGVRAMVLAFDEISAPSTGTVMPVGYGGLNWDNVGVIFL